VPHRTDTQTARRHWLSRSCWFTHTECRLPACARGPTERPAERSYLRLLLLLARQPHARGLSYRRSKLRLVWRPVSRSACVRSATGHTPAAISDRHSLCLAASMAKRSSKGASSATHHGGGRRRSGQSKRARATRPPAKALVQAPRRTRTGRSAGPPPLPTLQTAADSKSTGRTTTNSSGKRKSTSTTTTTTIPNAQPINAATEHGATTICIES